MKVLIACEFSGIVREAFIKQGHYATSCDLLDTEIPGPHIKGNIDEVDFSQYDLMIAHPPCTHLAVSGACWFKYKKKEQEAAIDFFMYLINAPVKHICVENPISIMSTVYRKPNQIIQPWMFGHKEQKATCLWLKNLPKLMPTKIVKEEMLRLPKRERERLHYMSPGPDRWKNRSRTFQGIADAMAEQWGNESEEG